MGFLLYNFNTPYMSTFYIDFHCHPSMKPYGRSFKKTPGKNDANRKKDNSIWFYDSPNLFERAIQLLAGISKFTQADFTTLSNGNVRLICASLYPIEKGFFANRLGTGVPSDLVDNFVTSVSKPRVDFIQKIKNYYADVENEYAFYKQLDGRVIMTESGPFTYRLVKNYTEIDQHLSGPNGDQIIFVVLSIEGMHILNDNLDAAPDLDMFKRNLAKLKAWEHPPFFVTFSHHFYNYLCGHARSLTDLVGSATDQSEGLNTGFTPFGKEIVGELLSNTNGKRILIDIKHLSALGRKEYFHMLSTEYAAENIPVIVSHGAANGLRSMDEPVADGKDTAYKLLAADINFYDNEILQMARSGGIFCLQLDERRIASKQTLKNTKHSLFINKIRHYRAELVWNQVQHIAELLDRHDLFAWDCIALGTDYEGVINPLNGYLTEETLVHLEEYVERHAYTYMNNRGKLLHSYNQIGPDEIVHRIFQSNGFDFIRKNFN
jgi:microsomal dipeptidase-like Zn-dependent dipeptidase